MNDLVKKESLSSDEISWRNGLETTIAKYLAGFYEVGYALMTIKDNRLYRDKYKTFEEYCTGRWAFNRRYADRLIRASYVIDNLKSNDDGFTDDQEDQDQIVPAKPNWPKDLIHSKLPATESQVRPLTKLPNDIQKKVWNLTLESAAGGERITAKDVNRAIFKVTNTEISKTTQRIKKRVEKDEMVSDEFKMAFMVFMSAIQDARDGGWEETSKAAALNHIYSLKTVIEV